jgi:hypothetical protein
MWLELDLGQEVINIEQFDHMSLKYALWTQPDFSFLCSGISLGEEVVEYLVTAKLNL